MDSVTVELAQEWTRYQVTADLRRFVDEFGAPLEISNVVVMFTEATDNTTEGNVFTDAWKLERGAAATAWAPSSLDVREILLAVPSATGSWANVALPGGGIYGLMPPVGEAWLPLGIAGYVGGMGGILPGAYVNFRLCKNGGEIMTPDDDMRATADTGWKASIGENTASNAVAFDSTPPDRLSVQVVQSNVTATNMMVAVRYLVYHK